MLSPEDSLSLLLSEESLSSRLLSGVFDRVVPTDSSRNRESSLSKTLQLDG